MLAEQHPYDPTNHRALQRILNQDQQTAAWRRRSGLSRNAIRDWVLRQISTNVPGCIDGGPSATAAAFRATAPALALITHAEQRVLRRLFDREIGGLQEFADVFTSVALLNRARCAHISVAQSAQAAHLIDVPGVCSQHGTDQKSQRMHVGLGARADQLADDFRSGSDQFSSGSFAGRCGFQTKGAASSVFAPHPVERNQSVDEADRPRVGKVHNPAEFIDAQPRVRNDRDQSGRCCAGETRRSFGGCADGIAERTGPGGDDVVITPRWTDMHASY